MYFISIQIVVVWERITIYSAWICQLLALTEGQKHNKGCLPEERWGWHKSVGREGLAKYSFVMWNLLLQWAHLWSPLFSKMNLDLSNISKRAGATSGRAYALIAIAQWVTNVGTFTESGGINISGLSFHSVYFLYFFVGSS